MMLFEFHDNIRDLRVLMESEFDLGFSIEDKVKTSTEVSSDSDLFVLHSYSLYKQKKLVYQPTISHPSIQKTQNIKTNPTPPTTRQIIQFRFLTIYNQINKSNNKEIEKLRMQSDTDLIVGLIRLMNTDQVVEAEQKLTAMVHGIEFLDIMFDIIKNPKQQPWVKTIAASFMNKVLCQRMQQFGHKPMFTAISRITTSPHISPTDKRCFQSSIISLIQSIKQPQQIQQWHQFILTHLNDYKLFDTALLLIACTTIAEIQIDYMCQIVGDVFQLTLAMCQEVSLENAMVCNQLVKCWIVVVDKLVAMEDDGEESVELLMVKICTSRQLAKLMFKIFQFSAPQQIWMCVNPSLYQLNLLKYQAAERTLSIICLKIVTKKVSQYTLKHNLPLQQCHCIHLITQSYHKIKNTIAVVGANTNLEIMQIYQSEDLITSLISLLIVYVKTLEEPQAIQDELNVLQHIVCYPFMKSREQELYTFEESASEFNTLAEDMCDKQTFGILKTQAARLLQAIADQSKTTLQKGIIFSIECIKMAIGYIPKYESPQVKILDLESAFQVLTILSFSLDNYPTELQKLKVILCDKRMMQVQPLTLARVFMFLAYNYGQVFKNPQDGSFWIQFALTYNKHPTTRYMSLDFISNIVDQYFTQHLFTQITQLILTCKQNQTGLVWDIVSKLFSSQKQHISQENCLFLVNTVFKRIEIEFLLLESKEKQSTQDVINAIHVLRKVVEDKEYMLQKETLKLRILDISVIYNKALALDLDDEVIKILTEYANNYITIAKEKILLLLNPMLEQFKKDEYYQNSYFVLFNQLIVGLRFEEVKPVVKMLLTGMMFHLFDMSENAKKRKMKIAIANILTLLQNLLSVHGYEMSGTKDDCMCEIGAMCIRLFPQQNQKIFSKSLLAKALNLMFICHLYSKTQNTIQYLFKYAKENIFHGYDAFVLVKLLSKAIFAQQNVHIVIEYLNIMIDVANEFEKGEKKSKSVKTANGKMKIKRQQELSNLLFNITSPFINFQYSKTKKHLPIKKQITECLTKMKSNNMETYKLIVMNMNEEQKSKLANILNQKVEIQGKNRVIRKVVGVKPTSEQQINEHSDVQEHEEEDSKNFKRKRVLLKKTQGKKKKQGNNINAQ